MIRSLVVGLTPIKIVHKSLLKNRIGDILIQNNTATGIVYVTTEETLGALGAAIPASGGVYRNDIIQHVDMWVVAAVAGTVIVIDLDYVDKRVR